MGLYVDSVTLFNYQYCLLSYYYDWMPFLTFSFAYFTETWHLQIRHANKPRTTTFKCASWREYKTPTSTLRYRTTTNTQHYNILNSQV